MDAVKSDLLQASASAPASHQTQTYCAREGDAVKDRSGELWRFYVGCDGAERVYLVRESAEGVSHWLPMSLSAAGGMWELQHRVGPGHYRFRYYTVEGSLFINCGSDGLVAQLLSERDPAVIMEPLLYAASA